MRNAQRPRINGTNDAKQLASWRLDASDLAIAVTYAPTEESATFLVTGKPTYRGRIDWPGRFGCIASRPDLAQA